MVKSVPDDEEEELRLLLLLLLRDLMDDSESCVQYSNSVLNFLKNPYGGFFW